MRSEVVLSARMEALTRMVSKGSRVCDVGCDHGWVSIYLVQQGISPRVLAMDVRQGPLSRAQEHIRQQGLEAYIETRLSDGVTALGMGEADTMICAGMGGRLMQRILEEGREKLASLRELILQPQSELPAFRAFLRRSGYVTVAEDMVYEEGKFYPMMKVVSGEQQGCHGAKESGRLETDGADGIDEQALQYRFGELLLRQRHPVLRQYLLTTKENNDRILQQMEQHAADGTRAAGRIAELREEQRLISLALAQYGAGSDRVQEGRLS